MERLSWMSRTRGGCTGHRVGLRIGHGHGGRLPASVPAAFLTAVPVAFLAALLVISIAPAPVWAVSRTSTGAGNWNTAGTWSPSGVPGAADDVTISNGHNVTLNTDGTCGSLSVPGTLTFDATAGRNLTITTSSGMTGDLAVSGALDIARASGQYITIQGSLSFSGSFSNHATPCQFYFTGTGSQTISSSAGLASITVNSSSLTLTSSSNVDLHDNLTVSAGTWNLSSYTANWIGGGASPTITVSNGATLKIGGTRTFPTGYTTHSLGATSTVEYSGTNQTVTDEDYGHLTLSGSGTKTMPGTAVSIAGNFTMSGTPSATAGSALTVSGNVSIGSGCTFNASSYSHSFGGDLTNDGTFTGSSSTVTFTGAASNSVSGGGTTAFNSVTINKGTSQSNVLDVTAVITLASGGLTFTNGTFKLSSNSTITPVTSDVYNSPFRIPANAGLWVNGGTVSVTSDMSFAGLVRVSSGTLTIGDAADERVFPATGATLTIDGGTLNVSGRLTTNQPTDTYTFTMSSGTLTVPTVGSTSGTYPPFNLPTAGSTFNMSGGTIYIRRAGTSNLGYLNAAGTTSVTGGTLQIGDASTPASQTILINASAPIWNLTVNGANPPAAQLATNALTVKGDVTLTSGTLNANSVGLSVAGNWTNNVSAAAFTPGTQTVTFNGASAQTCGGSYGTAFNSITLDNANGLTLTAAASASGTLTLTSGKITLGTNDLTFGSAGSISGASASNYVVTNSTGALVRQGVGTASATYPVGTASSYLPATVKTASGTADFSYRVAGSVTPSLPDDERAIKRTWVLARTSGSANPSEISLQWNAGDEGSSFTRASSKPFLYGSTCWYNTGSATLSGSGPYLATITGLSSVGSYTMDTPYLISGKVFEDVNYGGGAGRNWTTASGDGGSARSSARLELYDGSGNYLSYAATDGSGDYSFSVAGSASHLVRAVSSSVTSSRTGYTASCLPVMTFRTDASSGTAADVTDHVGGIDPAAASVGNADTGWVLNGTTGAFTGGGSGKAQAFSAVTVGSANVTGVDFGFNFDTIVNVNDTSTGSLRQFLTNANLLSNSGLAQSGRTAGIENAVFMLADGTARAGMNTDYASQFSGGVATFTPGSALPAVTDPVVLDGQTQPGWASSPILELSGASAGSAHGFDVTAGSSTVRGWTINRFTGADKAGVRLATAGGNTVQGCWIGTDKTGASASANTQGVRIEGSTGNSVGGTGAGAGNVIRGSTGVGVLVSAGTGHAIEGNAIYGNGGLGIDLGGDGVTANDGTKDGGLPNSGMDFPVVTAAYLFGTTLSFSGYVGSAANQSAFGGARVELFESDDDASGHGEGAGYLGSVTADADGNFTGTVAVSGLTAGDKIAATATDGSGNTSEFGANATIGTLGMVKRTFDADGEAVATGSVMAKGAVFRFLLYVDNRGGAATDVRLSDALDPAFEYVAGSLRVADVTANCATGTCTSGEEAAMLTDALAGSTLTDAVDGDTGAVSGTTVQIGKANAGNGRLDLAANTVYVVTFQVKMR